MLVRATVAVALFTVNIWALDVPPPGVVLKTVILSVPTTVRSLAGIDTVNRVALTYVVVLSEPLNRTIELDIKLVPSTVIVKPTSP